MNLRNCTDAYADEEHGEDSNTSANPSMQDVVAHYLSRREILRIRQSAGAAVMGTLSSSALAGLAETASPEATQTIKLNFPAVPKSTGDALRIAPGYTARVLYATGDPLSTSTPEYRNDGTDTEFSDRAGDHADGIEYFGLNADGTAPDAAGCERGILAMNHEAVTDHFLHPHGATARPRPSVEADKEIDAHGLSFFEIRKSQGGFACQKNSIYNRRVTPLTPAELRGPVRGSALLSTPYSPEGTHARGTINNCGASSTPWGTFLSGEENWSGYFTRSSSDDAARGGRSAKSVVSLNRYGCRQGAASRHGWETAGTSVRFARWDVSLKTSSVDGRHDWRNELNTFGYMVEVDPYDRTQPIRKRTALGRFAHEKGIFGLPVPGQPLAVYMGDDARGEYIYKFVSAAPWDAADANPAHRMAAGDKYLDSGKLYVARFDGDGSGHWIELHIENAAIAKHAEYHFSDQADVLVNARLAADAVGATRMDRPQWCAVHPTTGEVYYAITAASGSGEPAAALAASGAPSASGLPEAGGHIIRIKEDGGHGAAAAFTWDVYLFGAEALTEAENANPSALTSGNDFSIPEALWFSKKTGLIYIDADSRTCTDLTNGMLLIGVPGLLGDGAAQANEHSNDDGARKASIPMGAKPTKDTLRRFLVGPRGSEITGIAETPDGTALFVNIQHPGEPINQEQMADPLAWSSHWPGNAGYGAGGTSARPRSATIVITRDDGGLIGIDGL